MMFVNFEAEVDLWRCTVCGRVGTVGRCCGEETRERVNMGSLQAEIEALRKALSKILENEASDWKSAEEFGGYVLDDVLREEARRALAKGNNND